MIIAMELRAWNERKERTICAFGHINNWSVAVDLKKSLADVPGTYART